MTFHFRPVLTLCALLGLAVLISLGVWQVQRLAWKKSLIAQVEERVETGATLDLGVAMKKWRAGDDLEYTKVSVNGTFQHDKEVHVFGTFEAKPGYYIYTPLLLETPTDFRAPYLYINRGFVPERAKEIDTRPEGAIEGVQEIVGLFRAPQTKSAFAKMFEAEDNPETNTWFTRDAQAFATNANIEVLPVFVDVYPEVSAVLLPQGGTTRLDFNNKHMEYALTWFGLAATLIGVWIAFSVGRRARN